jgi:hypothetical protein
MQQTFFQDAVEKIKSLLDKNNISYTSYENNFSVAITTYTKPNIEIITIGKKDLCIYFRIHSPNWRNIVYNRKYDRPYSLEEIFNDFMKAREECVETEDKAVEIAKEKVLAMQGAKMGEMLDILNSTTLISAVQHMKTIIEKELKDMKYFVEEMKHMGADGNFTEKEYLQKKDEYNNHPHHLKLEIIYDRLNELLSESFLIKD